MNEGLSFIVRIRDEEDTLEESIRSLFGIRVLHEILLILHMCKDRSKEIADKLASENPNIRVFEYTTPISRAGYETLCTDKDSPHSIMTYYTWCYNQSVCPWKFKWDADFIASTELVEYINSCGWSENLTKSHELFFTASSPEGYQNTERYIVSGNFSFQKYWFWEFVEMGNPILKLQTGIVFDHKSPLSCKKKYWSHTPWFLDSSYLTSQPHHYPEAITVLRRYVKLLEICGPEPNGQARASNPDSANIFITVKENIERLKEFDINHAL